MQEMSIVRIRWIDAETIGDSGWQDLEEVKESIETEPPTMITVGFVLGEYATHITLTDSLGTKECGHLTKIPIEMIKSIDILIEADSIV
jgi:hypothetical protein